MGNEACEHSYQATTLTPPESLQTVREELSFRRDVRSILYDKRWPATGDGQARLLSNVELPFPLNDAVTTHGEGSISTAAYRERLLVPFLLSGFSGGASDLHSCRVAVLPALPSKICIKDGAALLIYSIRGTCACAGFISPNARRFESIPVPRVSCSGKHIS